MTKKKREQGMKESVAELEGWGPFDSPDEYRTLSHHERGTLQAWIEENIGPRKTPNPRTSYGLKHAFANSANGCYTTNGQFKGAMLAAGYRPVDAHALNWTFRISTKGVPYA